MSRGPVSSGGAGPKLASSSPPFEFPSYYTRQPFFTVQPVLNTRKKQSQLWGDLIVSYCRHNKIYELNLTEAATSPLFCNTTINRKLSMDGIVTFIDDLVQQGNAEWVDAREKNRVNIFWRKIDHWATLIYKWVSDMGMLGNVLTVWEIQNGENSQGQEFFELDTRVLMKALGVLEREGKAQVFSGTSDENLGVKFFAP
ncbi:vacuolar protein sorting 25 [Pelomyxa schiedti]|nr:vacuolar protein sorting 25 [Pelomyxa schiedti]